jgi:transposase InsO family protein
MPALFADNSLNGHKVALVLSQLVAERGAPLSITADNGSEFVSKAMDAWTYQHDVKLNFIRPCRPVENSYIESFNGRLRDECLNVEVVLRTRRRPGEAGELAPGSQSGAAAQCASRSCSRGVCKSLAAGFELGFRAHRWASRPSAGRRVARP